jgi:hypothetical protein
MADGTKKLKERKTSGLTRRQFFKISATGALVAGTFAMGSLRSGIRQVV